MEKDINFYRKCLKEELKKPFNKIDLMYAQHLDEIINNLKKEISKWKKAKEVDLKILSNYSILP